MEIEPVKQMERGEFLCACRSSGVQISPSCVLIKIYIWGKEGGGGGEEGKLSDSF